MRNIIGPPVVGDELKFRDSEIAAIIDMLDNGNSVLLTGLRRIGKSSVMIAVRDRAPKEWLVSYHNVQEKRSMMDLFTILLASLPQDDVEGVISLWAQLKTAPSRFINFIKKNIRRLGGFELEAEFDQTLIDYWQPLTAGIEKILFQRTSPVVLILDEFPFFMEHLMNNGVPARAIEEVLGMFKRWRQDYLSFRLILGGSISLEHILAKHGISTSTINNLLPYDIPPLSPEQAKLFLRELADSHKLEWLSDEHIYECIKLIEDLYPSFLHAFFHEIRLHGAPGKPLSAVFENHFIPSIRGSYFRQFDERLKSHYRPEERSAARAIFECIACAAGYRANHAELQKALVNNPKCSSVELDDLLPDLISDQFLTIDASTRKYAFTACLVSRWWQTRG